MSASWDHVVLIVIAALLLQDLMHMSGSRLFQKLVFGRFDLAVLWQLSYLLFVSVCLQAA